MTTYSFESWLSEIPVKVMYEYTEAVVETSGGYTTGAGPFIEVLGVYIAEYPGVNLKDLIDEKFISMYESDALQRPNN